MSDSLKGLLADISKKEDFRLGRLDEAGIDVQGITTGNVAIDHSVGVGGLPLGRSIELYGPPSSGKTTCAIQTAAAFQQSDDPRSIIYYDYEQSIDPIYCGALGLNIADDSFIFGQPDVIEQAMNSLDLLLPTNEIGLIIFDSVASMQTREMLEDSVEKAGIAQQARMLSKSLRRLNSQLSHANCAAIWLNHLSYDMSIGGRPGMPPVKTTPGGRALKFYASVRIEFQQIGNNTEVAQNEISGEDEKISTSTKVKVKVVKNKVAPPFKTCVVQVDYGKGFSNFYSAQQILTSRKVIQNTGAFFYFDEKNGAGELIHPDMSQQATGTKRWYVKGAGKLSEFATAHPEWAVLAIEMAKGLLGAPIPEGDQTGEISEPEVDLEPTQAVPPVTDVFASASNDDVDLDELLST